ncbi:hypothetical protein K7432_012605 [Basidiobolus ranarum]|uniref:Uncharacterized protein n=1 Tax=Basidiobolus ranarum TaxID=34480 RepID=A0ABR2VSX3_9FUNG
MSSIDNETEANIEQVGSENEEYEVESVLASRTTPKGKEYLVKWKDYSEDQATWEKRRNLEHCSALIYAFEAHASKAETAKSHQNSPSLKRKNLETTYEEVTKRLKSLIRSKVPEKEELETLLKQLNKAETVQEKEAILLICNEKLEAVESAQIIEIQNLSEQSEDSDIVLTSPTPLVRNTHSEQNNALTTPKNSMKSHTANGSERVTRSGKKIDMTAPNSSSKNKRRNISSVESFQHEKKEDPVTVVRILAHQISGNGKPRYQAEWSNGHTSWLHDREIDDHLDLIEDFEHSEYSKENPQSSADVTSSSLHSFDSYQNDPFITSFQDPAFFIDVPQLPLPHTDYVWYPEVSVIIDVEPTEPNESVEQQDFKPSDGESSPNMSDASDTTDSEMEEESDDLTPKVRNYQRLTKRTRNSNKIMGSDSEELKSVNHSKRLRIEDSSSDELSSEPQRRSQRKLFHRVVPPGEQQFYADAGKTVRDLDEEYMEVDEEINTSDPEENDDSIQAHCYQCGKKGEIPLRIEPDSKSNFLLPCHRCSYVAHKQCYVEAFDESYEDGFNTEIVDNETSSRRKRRITIWKCHDCQVWPKDVEKILTFRYLDEEKEHNLIEDWENESGTDILYLVKFKTLSYHHVEWVTSRWLFDVSPALLRAFIKKNPESQPPEKVIRKEWTLVDRLLDVRFKDKVSIGHATPDDVDAMFAKWQNLPYDEATWDDPPKAGSEEYDHYAQAFRKFIKKCQVKVPSRHSQKSTGKFIELKKQPSYLKGGELMPFQLEGVNWLLYKWLDQSSCILADEMGLGKTVQIIAFLSILFNARAVFPFLIVVPNSVLANWLMEFSKWEPELVVATYSGSSASRKLIRKYEMFQEGSNSQLRCHVVITTYEMIIQETAVFKKNFWEVLVVDEGHKLKNETNKFFTKLSEVKAGHKVILTGTPLQNNIRELFNLLSFIDPKSFKMKAELEEKYEHLSKDLVGELHELVKPYILRRTKAEVLTTLPSKHEVIVPVSMTLLQKEIYKGILGRNYQLLKSITGKNSKSNQKKSSMLNILMELRKCLNHPYLINGVEETFTSLEETQIRLIEASGKMALLDRLLKKLKEQGHRVLIFSQFQIMLDILEDYLVCEDYKFLRIDGSTVGEVRQQYIDAFNKPDSDYFVFLLSTRAGGVGLNLATADTVIIFDPDFNPHADMQAISRAHRIGQKNTVLVLKLVTKNSAEQKIMEVAKTKLVLDHLVIERLDDDDMDTTDVESILKFGAKALFDEENNPGLAETRTIKYDDSALEQLLERANCEPDPSSTPRIADSSGGAFSFARVWVNDNGTEDSETQDENYWDNILKDRLAESRKEDAVEYGRGARRTKKIHYSEQLDATPSESVPKNKSRMIRMPEDKEYENVVLSESESETMDDIEKDELPVQNPAEPTAVPPATSASKTSVSQKPTLWQLKPQNFVNLPAPNSITGTQQPYAPTSSISQAYSPSAVPISQLSELNDISNIPRLVSIRQALLNRYTNYHNSLANANQPLQQGQSVGLPSTSTNISSQQTQATSLPGSTTPATVFRSPQQSQVASLPNSTVLTVAYIKYIGNTISFKVSTLIFDQ